jgi:hypothetical protein
MIVRSEGAPMKPTLKKAIASPQANEVTAAFCY